MKPFHTALIFLVLMLLHRVCECRINLFICITLALENKIRSLTIYESDKTITTLKMREVIPKPGIGCPIPIAPMEHQFFIFPNHPFSKEADTLKREQA